MGADFRAFFQQNHTEFLTFVSGQLLESDGGCQSGRATTNDDDVVFHYIAFNLF